MDSNKISGKIRKFTGRAKQEYSKQEGGSLPKALEGKRDELLGVAQEKYGEVKETAGNLADTIAVRSDQAKQQVDARLSEYNEKLASAADYLPGDVNQTVTRYPWMTIVAVLLLGIAIGFWLKPCFKRYEYKYQYPAEYPQNTV